MPDLEETLIQMLVAFLDPKYPEEVLREKSTIELLWIAQSLNVNQYKAEDYECLGLQLDKVKQVLNFPQVHLVPPLSTH